MEQMDTLFDEDAGDAGAPPQSPPASGHNRVPSLVEAADKHYGAIRKRDRENEKRNREHEKWSLEERLALAKEIGEIHALTGGGEPFQRAMMRAKVLKQSSCYRYLTVSQWISIPTWEWNEGMPDRFDLSTYKTWSQVLKAATDWKAWLDARARREAARKAAQEAEQEAMKVEAAGRGTARRLREEAEREDDPTEAEGLEQQAEEAEEAAKGKAEMIRNVAQENLKKNPGPNKPRYTFRWKGGDVVKEGGGTFPDMPETCYHMQRECEIYIAFRDRVADLVDKMIPPHYAFSITVAVDKRSMAEEDQ